MDELIIAVDIPIVYIEENTIDDSAACAMEITINQLAD